MRLETKRFIRDESGQIILWQSPNLLLSGWIVLKVTTLVLSAGHVRAGLEQLSTAILFTWAVYEAAKGVNYFRKTLGVIVLAVITAGFFR